MYLSRCGDYRLIVALLISVTLSFHASSAQNGVENLGNLQVFDLSSDGSLVFGYRPPELSQLILWSSPSSETIITLPGGSQLGEAGLGMSADGSIVVGTEFPMDFDSWVNCNPNNPDWKPEDQMLPWSWTGGTTSRLDPPDNFCYEAMAVSNSGKIAGTRYESDGGPPTSYAFSYDGTFTDLHPAGYDASRPYAISADGSVIVGWAIQGGISHILMWTASGVQVLFQGTSASMSDDGTVVVGIDYSQSPPAIVRWTSNGIQTITQNHGGFAIVSGDGNSISFTQSGAFGPYNGWHARIWNATNGDESLWQLLTDVGVDTANWQFSMARGLSFDGGIVAGRDNALGASYLATISPVCSVPKSGLVGNEIRWTNGVGGSFQDGTNWDGGKHPGPDSIAVFGIGGGTYTVTMNTAVENRRLDVDGDVTTLQIDTGPYQLTGESPILPGGVCGQLESIKVLSRSGRSSNLIITSGGVEAVGQAVVGTEGPETAELTISGSNASLSVPSGTGDPSEFVVGSDSNAKGVVLVEQGGTMQSNYVTILGREYGTEASVIVTGPGSKWTSVLMGIGVRGTSTVYVENEGELEAEAISLGIDPQSVGSLTVSGDKSRVSVESSIGIGAEGSGTITVKDQGSLIGGAAAIIELGSTAGGEGFLYVMDAGSLFENNGTMSIGRKSPGTMEITNGAAAVTSELSVGDLDEGIVRIDGANSRLEVTIPTLLVNVGQNGRGTLEITDGGQFVSVSNLVIGAEPTVNTNSELGTLRVAGVASTVIAPSLVIGNRSQGEASFESVSVTFPTSVDVGVQGFDTDLTPSHLELTNGAILTTGKLTVGGGNGIVRVRSGSTLQAGTGWTGGSFSGARGEVFIEDPGSLLEITGKLTIGVNGQGLLNVSSGGSANLGELEVLNGAVVGANIVVQPPAPKAGAVTAATENTITTSALLLGDDAVLDVDHIEIQPGAVVGGSGSYPRSLTSSGTVSPGDSPGHVATFQADSSYTQTADGSLLIELAGIAEEEYDRFIVAETARLAGTLSLHVIEGYSPAVGDEVVIIEAAQVEGTFDEILTDGEYVVDVTYGVTSVSVKVVSFVAAETEEELPSEFRLSQNYPNPFNPTTTIEFDIPSPQHVRLEVYDVLGRRVSVLVDERIKAGRHLAQFHGHSLPSGSYIYRLSSDTFEASRTLHLVK